MKRKITIGLTGTQIGMNDLQKSLFTKMLKDLGNEFISITFHHGDCIGADTDAHTLIREFLPHAKIIIHPPKNKLKRAYCEGDIVLAPEEYLIRNRDIVDASSWVFGFPKTNKEELRSGTWYTIKYARKTGRKVLEVV